MTDQPYDQDGDSSPNRGDGSPSWLSERIERAVACHNDAQSAMWYMIERYGTRGLAALLNVIDDEYGTHSEVLLERQQVENYAYARYNLYVDDLWGHVRDSPEFIYVLHRARDYIADRLPALVEQALQELARPKEDD